MGSQCVRLFSLSPLPEAAIGVYEMCTEDFGCHYVGPWYFQIALFGFFGFVFERKEDSNSNVLCDW